MTTQAYVIEKLQLTTQAVAPHQGEANIFCRVDPCFLLT